MSRMRVDAKVEVTDQSDNAIKVWDCGSPLYDSYELASVTHLIERHLMTLPSLGGSKRFKSHHHHHHQTTQINHASSTVVITASMVSSMKASNKPGSGCLVLGRLSSCMGNNSVWRRIKGERIKKVKSNKQKLRPNAVKWFT